MPLSFTYKMKWRRSWLRRLRSHTTFRFGRKKSYRIGMITFFVDVETTLLRCFSSIIVFAFQSGGQRGEIYPRSFISCCLCRLENVLNETSLMAYKTLGDILSLSECGVSRLLTREAFNEDLWVNMLCGSSNCGRKCLTALADHKQFVLTHPVGNAPLAEAV